MVFTKIHLQLDCPDFRPPSLERPPGLTSVKAIPRFPRFMADIAQVGTTESNPAGDRWHLRKEFHEEPDRTNITGEIERGRLWRFRHHGVDIGFCYVIYDSDDLRATFGNAANAAKQIEIYKIALFETYTRRGFGKHLLSDVIADVFESGFDRIYLTTRAENHVNSVPVYEALGFRVLKTESLPDDIQPPKPTRHPA